MTVFGNAKSVYLGNTLVDKVFSENIKHYDSVLSTDALHNRRIFSTTWTDAMAETPAGLTYSTGSPESLFDFTGVAVAVTTGATIRSPITCCTLVGPSSSTHYAAVNDHARPSVGSIVYWINSDNVEISRTVASVNAHDGVALIEFTAPISSTIDKCKIYPVISNYSETNIIEGLHLVCVEQDRLLTTRKVGGTFGGKTINHQTLYTGGELESGDSGKPAFLIKNDNLVIIIAGAFATTFSVGWSYYADSFDAVMLADHGYTMQRVVI